MRTSAKTVDWLAETVVIGGIRYHTADVLAFIRMDVQNARRANRAVVSVARNCPGHHGALNAVKDVRDAAMRDARTMKEACHAIH